MAQPETVNLTCPHCRHAFPAAVWHVLDLGRDPGLRERFLRGEINVARCPQAGCGFEGFVDVPLAVHDPQDERVLFLIPDHAELSPAGQQAAEGELGDALMAALGRVPAANYFFKPAVVTGPAELAETLSLQPPVRPPLVPPNFGGEAGEGEPEQDEDGDEDEEVQKALELVRQVLMADDPEAFVRAHLDAFDGTVLAVWAAAVEQTQSDGEAELAEALQALVGLVLRLKLEETSPELAQATETLRTLFEFVRAETWAESRRIVEQHPELLSDEADALLGQVIDTAREQADEDEVHIFEEHRALLRRCRKVGVEQAFAEKTGLSPEELAAAEALAQLPPEVREVLAELAAGGVEITSPEDLERALAERPDLQQKLRDAVQAMGAGPTVPPAFTDDVALADRAERRYRETGDRAALDEAVEAWERILSHPDLPNYVDFHLAALNDGGGMFLRRYWAQGQVADLNTALTCFERAVALTAEGSPDLPSRLNNLASGLSDRYGRSGELADLEAAIGHWQRAVALTAEGSPDLPS
ncbi:MAG: CpXC domain-containing protein, partial [Anaerolineae bacterium]